MVMSMVTANIHSVLDKLAHAVCRILYGTDDVTQPESVAEAMETHGHITHLPKVT